MQELRITENEAGQRLDKLLAKFLNQAPKSFLYKMLRKKNITLNGKKATGGEKLENGDVVKLFLSDETIEKFSADRLQTAGRRRSLETAPDILYEDAQILLLNKPVGMLSQKAKESDFSAVEFLIQYLLDSGQISRRELQTFHPAVCNRLDRNTSGILAAGKSLAGLQELSRFFKERTIEKYYLCLVSGTVKERACVKGFLYKNEKTNKVQISSAETPDSAAIETEYRPLCTTGDVTLLEVHLITGKTHQIRAHLAAQGHPIIGDYKYGDRKINHLYQTQYGLASQLLHAYRVRMPESDGVLDYLSGKEFTAQPPGLFQKICKDKGVMIWEPGIPEDYEGQRWKN